MSTIGQKNFLQNLTSQYLNDQKTSNKVPEATNNIGNNGNEALRLMNSMLVDDGVISQDEIDTVNNALKSAGSDQVVSINPSTFTFSITNSRMQGSTQATNIDINYKNVSSDISAFSNFSKLDMDNPTQRKQARDLIANSLGFSPSTTDVQQKSMLEYNMALLDKRDDFMDKFFKNKPDMKDEFISMIASGAPDIKSFESFINRMKLSPTDKFDFIVMNPDMMLDNKTALIRSSNIGEIREKITANNTPLVSFSNASQAETFIKNKINTFNDNVVKDLRTKFSSQNMEFNDVRVASVGDGTGTKGLGNVSSLGIGLFAFGSGNTQNNNVPILTPADKPLTVTLKVQGLESTLRNTDGAVNYVDKSGNNKQLFFRMGVDNIGQSTITFYTNNNRNVILNPLPSEVTFNNGQLTIDTQTSSVSNINLSSVQSEDAEVQVGTNGKIVPESLNLKDYYASGSYVLDIQKLKNNSSDRDAYLFMVNNLRNEGNIDNALKRLNLSGEGVNNSAEAAKDLGDNEVYRSTAIKFGQTFDINSSTDGVGVNSFVQTNELPKNLVSSFNGNSGKNNDVLSAMRTLQLSKQALFDAGFTLDEINSKSVKINVNGKVVDVKLSEVKPDPTKHVLP